MKRLVLAIALTLTSCGQTPAFSAHPDFERLADAIHITENGHSLDKGEQYGIHTIHYANEAEARAICIRTCKHAWRDHKGDYMTFLAKRYCPVNWRIWLKNTHYFMSLDKGMPIHI